MANVFDQFDEEPENVFDQFDPEREERGVSLLEREKEIPTIPAPAEEIAEPEVTSNVQSTLIKPSDGSGKKEQVYFEESREEITVPAGGSSVLHEIMQDAAFDDTVDDPDSTILEETLATIEKQAAYLALLANAYGFVNDEDIDDFIADRSRALSNAQKHAPAYMTGFQAEYQKAEGFYEHAGVILSNPRAIGRLIVTQAPNSIIPLLTGLLGAVGGPAGFLGGTFAGGSIVEIGAWMDQEIQRRGVDMGNREQVLAVLQDEAFMTAITREAERKGLSTAAVDTLFAAFGGQLMRKAIKGTSTFSRAGRFAGLVGTETVGEATGEAAGAAVVGKLDIPDAVLEGIAGFGQSVGQAGISATLAKGREGIKAIAGKAEEAPVTEVAPAEEGVMTETEKLERAVEEIREEEAVEEEVVEPAEEVEGVEDITPETTAKVVEEIDTITTEIIENPPEGVSEEELETDGGERIEKALEAIAPTQKTRELLIKGRITKLESDREALNKQLDDLETLRDKTAKPSKSLENKIEKLQDDLVLLDVELDNMIILGLANDLKVSKKVSTIERKREAKETEKKIQINEAELILEELEQGNEPERQFRRDAEGFLEEVFQVRSTNPPFLFGDLDTVGLTQTPGKRPNRRSKRSVINAVKRVINGKPAPTQPAQAALHQRILDIIEDRVSGELPRFQPGSGFEDPIRANAAQSIAELQAEEGVATIQDLFNALKNKDILREAEIDVTKPIQITGEKLVKLEQESLRAQERALKQGLREGARLAKTNIKQARRNIRDLINASALSAADKKSILALAEFDTVEDIVKSLPRLQTRIAVAFDRTQRKRLLSEIKKVVRRVKKAKNISIDAVRAIEALVNDIEFGKQSEQERERLQRAFIGLSDLPAAIVNKLERLSRTSVDDLSNQDLQTLLDEIKKLAELGKVKLRTRKEIKKLQQERDLRLIKADGRKIEDAPGVTQQSKGIGGRLGWSENVTNVFHKSFNVGKRKFLALTPMDVVFNMLSKTGEFKGAVTQIFKRPVDKAFREYNKRKIIAQDTIMKAVDDFEITDSSRERILVFAQIRQDGEAKLLASGYTKQALDELAEEGLTENEMNVLNVITDEFEKLRPEVQQTLKVVDNKDFTAIKDFFPMMTDFTAMETNEIRNRFGKDVSILEGDTDTSDGLKRNVVLSSTFKRTGAGVPIKLDAVDVAFRHIDNALYYIHNAELLQDLGRLSATEEFGTSVGNIGQDITRDWIDLLARKGSAQGNRIPIIDWIRRNTAWVVLGYKLSSIIIQPTALMDGAAIIGSYAFKGARNMLSREWRDFIRNNFTEIKLRMGDDIAFRDLMQGGKGAPLVSGTVGDGMGSALAKLRRHAFWGLRTLDGITATAIAAGAYEKIVTEKGDVVDFNNPDEEAILDAELIVRRTQSTGDFKNAPSATSMGTFTNNVSVDKLIFQFQTFLLTRFSLITQLVSDQGFRLRPTPEALNLLTWLTLAIVTEVALRRGVQELLAVATGEDLDDFSDEFLAKLARGAISTVPVLGQAVNSFQYGNLSIPATNMLDFGLENFQISINTKSGQKKYKRALRAIIILGGTLGGIPGSLQVEQIIRNVWKIDDSKKGSAAIIERLTR